MHCKKCGALVTGGADKCPNCGEDPYTPKEVRTKEEIEGLKKILKAK